MSNTNTQPNLTPPYVTSNPNLNNPYKGVSLQSMNSKCAQQLLFSTFSGGSSKKNKKYKKYKKNKKNKKNKSTKKKQTLKKFSKKKKTLKKFTKKKNTLKKFIKGGSGSSNNTYTGSDLNNSGTTQPRPSYGAQFPTGAPSSPGSNWPSNIWKSSQNVFAQHFRQNDHNKKLLSQHLN
jgi:hypothetical protein